MIKTNLLILLCLALSAFTVWQNRELEKAFDAADCQVARFEQLTSAASLRATRSNL